MDTIDSRIANETAFRGGQLIGIKHESTTLWFVVQWRTARPVGYCAHVPCNRMCKAHQQPAERDLSATCHKLRERRSKLPFPSPSLQLVVATRINLAVETSPPRNYEFVVHSCFPFLSSSSSFFSRGRGDYSSMQKRFDSSVRM